MTIIAWRGNTIAADRMACTGDTQMMAAKLIRECDGRIFGFCGPLGPSLLLMEWYKAGADPEKWPKCQEDKELWATLIVWEPREPAPFWYQQFPVKFRNDGNEYLVWGSGREVAIGAFHHGATAVEAVEACNVHCSGCGFGVTSFSR